MKIPPVPPQPAVDFDEDDRGDPGLLLVWFVLAFALTFLGWGAFILYLLIRVSA